MIRMTRQADYGIVLLTCFAQSEGGGPYNARELAGKVHLPVPMVAKILKGLAREGLLSSQRGVHGGYCLARPATEISVAEIIVALEGPIGITDCSSMETFSCDIAALCAVKSNWQTINLVVREALDQISLARMASPMNLADGTPDGGAVESPVAERVERTSS
ncbi:MAG: SUF system Fe-S cluster assembly regulator [Planctomycetota bacterium]